MAEPCNSLMSSGVDPEVGGAKLLPTPKSASLLRRILFAGAAIAATALAACLFLRTTVINVSGDDMLVTVDVPATETLEETNACAEYPYLKFVKTLHSNLGGHGPDQGAEGITYLTEMRGAAAGDDVGKMVELELHAMGTYHPAAPKANGMQGKYGSVNIMHGTSVDIMFSVRHHHTKEPLHLKHVAMTFFDLDQGPGGKCQESVTIGGFDKVIVTDNTEVQQKERSDGRTSFLASTFGTGEDNPKDPMYLTDQQKNRAVSLIFSDFHQHKVTLKAEPGATPRFFTFIVRPSLLCAATVQEGYVPPTTTKAPKYPPLEFGPVGFKPVVVPPHRIFIKWLVEMDQDVQVDDPIAVVRPALHNSRRLSEGNKEIIKSPHKGKVVDMAPLQPGDIIDDRMVDHNIVKLDERLDPLPIAEKQGEKGEEESRSLYFVKWDKEVGEVVKKGDDIATLSNKDPLVSGGAAGKETIVHATGDGIVKSEEPFVKGDEVGDVKQDIEGKAVIAVITPEAGIPWWIWPLLACLAAACLACILFLLCCRKEKVKETYKPLAPLADPAPPPPPPPAPAPVIPGLRLDFDDHKGKIHTIYAEYRPLGIMNSEKAPIDVSRHTVNSYAKSKGVQPDWTIVRVGAVDVRGNTNYSQVKRLIDDGLKDYPIWSLKLELSQDGTGQKQTYDFPCRPLGFEFDNRAPIKVKQVYPNSQAKNMGMKDYLRDKQSWTLCKLSDVDLPVENHDFLKIFQMMKEGSRALDPYSTNDGSKSVDQLKGWD